MTTATATAARFSVNVRLDGVEVWTAARAAVETLGATYERGFGRLGNAQMMFTNTTSVDLKAVRAAVAAVAPQGATIKVAKLAAK